MLKIVYRICCGMDVHKSFVVACIASTNEQGVTLYKSKVNFLVESHYCGWEGIERRLGALMLEEIMGEGGDEKEDEDD